MLLTFRLEPDGQGQFIALNNTYKAVRIIGKDYNLYYSVWCNNEHELYDLEVNMHHSWQNKPIMGDRTDN